MLKSVVFVGAAVVLLALIHFAHMLGRIHAAMLQKPDPNPDHLRRDHAAFLVMVCGCVAVMIAYCWLAYSLGPGYETGLIVAVIAVLVLSRPPYDVPAVQMRVWRPALVTLILVSLLTFVDGMLRLAGTSLFGVLLPFM